MTLNNYGILNEVSESGGGIFLVGGSNFNFFSGGSFTSVVVTFIQIYDITTGLNIGEPKSLSVSFSGPFYVIISISGEVSTSTTSKLEFRTHISSNRTCFV